MWYSIPAEVLLIACPALPAILPPSSLKRGGLNIGWLKSVLVLRPEKAKSPKEMQFFYAPSSLVLSKCFGPPTMVGAVFDFKDRGWGIGIDWLVPVVGWGAKLWFSARDDIIKLILTCVHLGHDFILLKFDVSQGHFQQIIAILLWNVNT